MPRQVLVSPSSLVRRKAGAERLLTFSCSSACQVCARSLELSRINHLLTGTPQVRGWPDHKETCKHHATMAKIGALTARPGYLQVIKDYPTYIHDIIPELSTAARSAFEFGSSRCDELRRTHLLWLFFEHDASKPTRRQRYKLITARLFSKEESNRLAFDLDGPRGIGNAIEPFFNLMNFNAKGEVPNYGVFAATICAKSDATSVLSGNAVYDHLSRTSFVRFLAARSLVACVLACADSSRLLAVAQNNIDPRESFSTYLGYSARKLNPD